MPPLLVLPFPAVDPIAISLGPFAVRWYALAYVLGIFLGWWYAKRLAADTRLWGPAGPPLTGRDLDDLVVWCAIGVVAGGRIGFVLFYDLAHYIANPGDILAVWNGGMSFHGGFVGTMLAIVIFAWRRKIPVWSLIDVVAPGVTFGLLLGRIANFVNGELWGRVSEVPWAMMFPTAPDGGVEPRHPSQLYEAFLEGILMFVVLRIVTHRYHRLATPGFVSGVFATWYGASRIMVEFFREPDIQIGFLPGGLTMGMLLSIPMVLAGIAVMVWSSRRPAAATGAGRA